MATESWIFVRPQLGDKLRKEEVRGVTVSIRISPHDVPQAFRGGYDQARGVFRIEFKYSDQELAEKKSPSDQCVSFETGRFSKRLLAIEIAVDKHSLDVVHLDLVKQGIERAREAVNRLRDANETMGVRLNYEAAGEVLDRAREKPEQLVSTG